LHHASSGDLDRRGHGDVPTITVKEYLARDARGRLIYRLVRHPLSLMLVGPLHLMLNQRFRGRSKATKTKQLYSVWYTNLAIAVAIVASILLWGPRAFLLVYLPCMYVAAAAGIWLFYVQHQFEDAYWETHDEWDYATAAITGSSHLRLNPVLQWFTGSIGLHHVHHIGPKIPNFRLQEAHDDNPIFEAAPSMTIGMGIKALRLALEKTYPQLGDLVLRDYKVRILESGAGTNSRTRVLIESGDGKAVWGTVGVSDNIIDASWEALRDAVEYKLARG
jgi:omega-6 fatty acid desaturase (delta-12 desaturase)